LLKTIPPPPPPATIKISAIPKDSGISIEVSAVVKICVMYPPEYVIAPPEAPDLFLVFPCAPKDPLTLLINCFFYPLII
jgi:hypothetical protein